MLRINHRYVFSTDRCGHVLYDPSNVTQKIVSFVSYLTFPFFSLHFFCLCRVSFRSRLFILLIFILDYTLLFASYVYEN